MTSLNVSLPKPLKDYIEDRVSAGGYSTPSEYVRDLIREDRKRRGQQKLESMLLEGLESGPSIKVDEKFWVERHKRLNRYVAKRKLK
ncbi:MAG: type II toxin-antitoxin system ParD family antitoxin [Candidatus Binataceae bacterium]